MSAALLEPVPALCASAAAALETARVHHAQNRLLAAAEAYREALGLDPQSQPALLGLSLLARQSNQLEPALRMAQAALVAGPGHALAWANYGDLLLAVRQFADAQAAYRRALILDPTAAAAQYGLANTLAFEENYAQAFPHFEAAANLAPNLPEFHFALAFAHGKLGRHLQAIAAYRRAVTLRPSFASAWLNLGVELVADGRDNLADPCYRQALVSSQSTSPPSAHIGTQISAHLNHGHLFRSRRNFPAARSHYQSALDLALQHSPKRLAEAYVASTYFHLEQQQFGAACQSLNLAQTAQQAHQPDQPNPEIPNVQGILLLAQHSMRVPQVSILRPGSDSSPDDLLAGAIQAFQQAEHQGHKTAPSNRGNALLRQGRVEEALAAHRTALDLDPQHPGVRYNLSLTQLRAGNFVEGWLNYEIRWQFREVHPHPRRFPQPRWQGEPLPPDARLFLYAEQGLGDTIQFLRYLPMAAARLGAPRLDSEAGDRSKSPFILEVQPRLTRLIAHSLPAIQVLSQGDPLPQFTHHCPLMSLPAIFGTTLATVPAPIPYLFAAQDRAKADAPPWTSSLDRGWEERIPKIGIHWAGNPNYRADWERSTTLQTFLPLLQLSQIRWISLQKGSAAQQISAIEPELRPFDACSQDSDLADTAALIQQLDLVLTTDSAIAHLAGALGKPLWLLLPWQSDWRWMQERLDTPWYPDARLFRQTSPNNWPELIQRVVGEITLWLRNRA